MAFQPSLPFISGAVLGASGLNVISDNIEYLAGLTEFVVPPFNSQAIGAATHSEHHGYRLHRYLHWKFTIPAGGAYTSFIKVYVNSNQIANITSSLTGPATHTGSYDFNSGAVGTSVNTWYFVETTSGGLTGNAATIWYIGESDASSLAAGSGSAGTYVPPSQWVPTNVPTAADMNKYRNAQLEINTRMGPYAWNQAVGQIDDGFFAVFCHKEQWLHYRSDNNPGALTDLNGENSVSLSGEVNTYNVYNLDTIPWMLPGVFFRVSGVTMAAELSQP